MKLSKSLEEFVGKTKESDLYWVEAAKLDFALELEDQRKRKGISYADVARGIASSAAYITKVFRGESNLTIESMVKLARATGGELRISIHPRAQNVRSWANVLEMDAYKASRDCSPGISIANSTTVTSSLISSELAA